MDANVRGAPVLVTRDGPTDEELMEQVSAGDRAAFAVLARRHAPRALALARRLGCGAGEDEDVVQEAMVRVWRAAERWNPDGGARFTTWFHRIVLNLCLDRRRRPAGLALEEIAEPEAPERPAPQRIAERQTADLLSQALDGLPERQRAAIALCYYDDHTAAEAAAVMGVTTGAVEQMLTRARRALRGKLRMLGVMGAEWVP
ncbi:sigma-70 family RNA polymerase sigma factor [Rhodocista pekingensis]|uniref:Sigma-70 family RNA polymerase sigma factor n=1 Tax=Rhodocista pekingensis TaxID=201185 RepID=A0ABW2L1B2_9PROT